MSLSSVVVAILCSILRQSNAQNTVCSAAALCQSTTVSVSGYIVCEGNRVCDGSDLYSTGSHIYCRGHYSCEGASGNPSNLVAYNDVHCESYVSCIYGYMQISGNGVDTDTGGTDLNTVICRGYLSCYLSTIIDSRYSYVYCYSQQACRNGTIANGNYALCYATQSCVYTQFNSMQRVFCLGYFGCDRAKITDTTTDMRCGGWYACRGAVITNGPYLRVGGERGLYQATVIGVKWIQVLGYYALQEGTISNTGIDGNMTVDFFGYNAGWNGTVICNYDDEDDICFINCYSTTACANLTLLCYATCVVDCDDSNGIACPYGWDGPSESPTQSPINPTTYPSQIPSSNPTLRPSTIPSIIPTSDPSIIPSNTPTELPSAIPTSNPSDRPTISPTNLPTSDPSSIPTFSPTNESSVNSGQGITGDDGSLCDVVTCVSDNMGFSIVIIMLVVLLMISICMNVVFVTRNKATRVVARELVGSLGVVSSSSAGSVSSNGVVGGQIDLAPISSGRNEATNLKRLGSDSMFGTNAMISTNGTLAMAMRSSSVSPEPPVGSNSTQIDENDIDVQLAIAIAKKLKQETNGGRNNGGEFQRRNDALAIGNAAGAAVAAIGAASQALSKPVPQADVDEAMYAAIELNDETEYDEGGRVNNSTK